MDMIDHIEFEPFVKGIGFTGERLRFETKDEFKTYVDKCKDPDGCVYEYWTTGGYVTRILRQYKF